MAETGDELKITLTNGDGAVYEKSYTATTANINAGKIEGLDITTDFAVTNTVLSLSGQVYLDGGEIAAPDGLAITLSNAERR